jgi:PiT family inorganic phosphate transporter
VSLQGGVLTYSFGYSLFNVRGLTKIGLALVISPVAGLLTGLLLMIMLMWIFRRFAPTRLNRWFRRLQVLSAALMAFSHGGNDAQKTMGIITMALVTGGVLSSFEVPLWVKVFCAAVMAAGTAVGGWRIIKTVGRNLMSLAAIHGFAAETSGALVIQTCTHLGAPISTTHVISSAIMGVGASRRLTAVRWRVAGQIVLAWVFTLPLCMLLGAIVYWVIS